VVPEWAIYGFLGGLVCGLAVFVWWMFFSRAPRLERWGAVPLMIAVAAVTRQTILHPSIQGGMMGMMFALFAIPVLSLALVLWAAATRRLGDGPRRAALVATILIACAGFALLRTDGVTGEGRSQFAWRWSKSAEQQLLARAAAEPAPAPPPRAPQAVEETKPDPPKAVLPTARAKPTMPAEWPGFRGRNRDGVVSGLRIKTDWNSTRPVELWRRAVGPGWSSFAAGDGLIYTQEQRGDFEVVSCYSKTTGEPVWTHRDAARFWESNAGAGPRATPTLHDGRIYTFGATGILNALDARSGSVVWTRNAASDTDTKVPDWGFSSSPLVVDDQVIIAVSGQLAAFDLATGKPRWVGPKAGGSYSSPHLLTIGGTEQVVLLSATGATTVAPADGSVLWKHAWEGYPILQPALTADGGLLITTGDAGGALGTRRLRVAHEPAGWKADEAWTSRGLKPYFNDLVVHAGHAFGFDGSILSCIDLQDGKRKWKGGRYGHGQMLLLRDQDLLLVLSEEGELALVGAVPGEFTEVARVQAIEGKTWNHPVLAGDILLVRNGQEMVAFRLSSAGS
jgi:outer membrane protein assembly factor BamB